jgi:hypothetical protein
MRIKQMFPSMLLVLGLVSILLVSMPGGVAYPFPWDNYPPTGGTGVDADKAAQDAGWTVKRNENTETGDVDITRTRQEPGTLDPDQWTTNISYNTKTGEYREERIVTHPDGSVDSATYKGTRGDDGTTDTHKVSDTHITQDGRKTTTTYYPDGSTKEVVSWDGSGRKYADNKYDDNDGRMRASESWDKDGTHYKTTYDANGHMISSEKTTPGPNGAKTVTHYLPAGASYSVTTDANGYVTSVSEVDGYGNVETAHFTGDCVMDIRLEHYGQILEGPGCHRTSLTRYDVGTGKTVVTKYDPNGRVISGTPTGDKDQVVADILGQIEVKPQGDLTGGQANLPAGMTQQPPVKVNGNVQPVPVGVLPVGKSGISSVTPANQSTGQTSQGIHPAHILPGRLPTKSAGNLNVSSKSKLNVTPGSKSVGKIWQSGGVSKLNVQPHVVQQNRINSKFKNWGSSAGSSGAFRAPR